MEKEKLVEAALFMSGRRMTRDELKHFSNMRDPRFSRNIEFIVKKYESLDIPIKITENEEGLKMEVKENYLASVKGLSSLTELNSGEVKTLSVIAYYQPITQADIVKIRGNRAYGHLSRLEGLGLISSSAHGRTKLLKTTERFKEYFGNIEKLQIK